MGQEDDPLLVRADNLVEGAQMHARAMFGSLLKQFSLLKTVSKDHWYFIVTVANVFIAATRLRNLRLGEIREEELMNTVSQRLIQWDAKNGMRAFEDCKSFFERTFDTLTKARHEPQFVAADAIGAWIVWNVLGRAPDFGDDELRLVRAVGVMTVHTFFDWWKIEAGQEQQH
jgi:hypothetical protein